MPRLHSLAAASLAALAAGLAACAAPPPEAYIAGGSTAVQAEPAGRDARNEECTVQPGRAPPADLPVSATREVFCGGWTQPAARVVELGGGAGSAATLDGLAAGGLWRGWLEQRVACGPPQPTTLGNGAPARLLACTRRNGGWPHLALVVAGPRGIVLADGMAATLPVIERLATGARPVAGAGGAAAAPRSAALALAVARLSATSFGAAEVGRYEQLMALGRDLNQAENFTAAEEAYRAALAVQERVLGRDDPNLATPLMHLALNLSNQGRHTQARPLFARAEALAPRAADPATPARLLHYRGMDLLNRQDHAGAAALLERAEALYARMVPLDALAAGVAEADELSDGSLLLDPLTQSALVGLAEAKRLRGVALGHAGRPEEGAALARDSRELLRRAGLEPALLVGRSLRTQAGSTVALAGRQAEGARLFNDSARRFERAVPGERPVAATLFLAGARLRETGRRAEALAAFRDGARILRSRQIALPTALVMPYLDALAEEAARRAGADAAALQGEMFEAAQLAQSAQTGRLVTQAAARLAASRGNPRVAEAVRRMQDSDRALRALYAERDAADSPRAVAAVDARIAEAQSARAEAEGAAAAAAPGYRQLLQTVADLGAVRGALGPREALMTMLLGEDHGYVFAVRGGGGDGSDGTVLARRVALSEPEAGRLVTRVRAGIAPAGGGGPGRFDTEAAQALYTALVVPAESALGGVETLLVAPDSPLLAIPFGLLLTGPADPAALREAPWLIRRYAVVHVPSPQTLVTLRNGAAASAAPRAYAGFGDPVPPSPAQLARSFPSERCAADARLAAQLGPLPGTRAEIAAARQFTGAAPDTVTLGAAFTGEALHRAALERSRVIHLATHALLPGELSCLTEPAIMVSTPRGAADAHGTFLPASDVLELKLDADLVILSACNTGTPTGAAGTREGEAAAEGGEALSGLARAFFFAGARGLLVTHWSVDDTAAALTVADTLRRQAQGGEASAAALRGAQLLLLEESGRRLPAAFAHPYYWAGFALIGDGRRAAAPPPPPRES